MISSLHGKRADLFARCGMAWPDHTVLSQLADLAEPPGSINARGWPTKTYDRMAPDHKPLEIVAAQLTLPAQTHGCRRLAQGPPEKSSSLSQVCCVGGIPRTNSSLQATILPPWSRRWNGNEFIVTTQEPTRGDIGWGATRHVEIAVNRQE